MSNKENKEGKEKNEEKGILDTIREVNRKERHERIKEEADKQKKRAEKNKKAKEEYSQKLNQEHLELIKIKQGIIEETEDVQTDSIESKKQYTLFEKISSFFYRNKAMVIVGTCFALIAAFLIYDYATKDNPDMTIMILINDEHLDHSKEEISKVFEQYIDDINGNGEVHVSAYYMPVSEDTDSYLLTANSTKLYALMQSGDTLLVMADKDVYEQIQPELTLDDLSAYYPENKNIKEYGFYVSESDFFKDIEYGGNAADDSDYYIGIRKVSNGAKYKKQMKKNYDIAFDALNKFIEKYS